MQTKLSRTAAPVLLIAVLALASCKQGDKPEDALAQDTSLARDLQLANADTAAQPQLKDVPVTVVPAETPSAQAPKVAQRQKASDILTPNKNPRRVATTPKSTPQPVETFREKLKVTDAVDRIPMRTFVQATVGETPFFAATFERAKASPGWKTVQVNSRHDVMVDQPDQMTKILLEAAPGSRGA